MDILNALFEKKDLNYADFSARLTPSIECGRIIGVRMPDIKKLAAEIDSCKALEFTNTLPHYYLEENLLHSALISRLYTEFDGALQKVTEFLPYVNNWAVCDTLAPPVLKKEPEKLYTEVKKWLKSGKTYTIRFGITCLMQFFMDDEYRPEALELVATANGDYYIDMAAAWFFCEALVKHWDDALRVLESNTLYKIVHNKTIQKARESFRISPEKKEFLKSLKRRL